MKFSLKIKAIIMIAMIVLLISTVSIISVRKGITDIVQAQYVQSTEDLADTVSAMIDVGQVKALRDAMLVTYAQVENRVSNDQWDSPEYERYVEHYSDIAEMPEYNSLQQELRIIQDNNHVDCIYLLYADLEAEASIYIVDAAYDDNCPPGSFDWFTDLDRTSMQTPEDGFKADITNTPEYGWVLALGKPVFDADRSIVAYVGVDVSMNEIMGMRNRYLLLVVAILLSLAIVITLASIWLVNKYIVRPVNILSDASLEYCGEETDAAHHSFADLNINTGDELESLAVSMAKMEEDINHHIANLIKTTKELISSREHEMELDHQANIDSLTRVKNKRAYAQETLRLSGEINAGTANFGIAMVDMNGLKELNDRYGHEKGDLGIQALCSRVCGVFKHSPVFRFGGDEFVVILERSDLLDVQSLVAKFDRRNAMEAATGNPWDNVTAAIGYAVYDPDKDSCVEDVFKRADQAMYQRKSSMKSAE